MKNKNKKQHNKKTKKNTKNIEPENFKFYRKNYKKFLIIPLIMFIFSIVMIINTTNSDGAAIYRDVSLKGGLSSIIETQTTLNDVDIKIYLEETFVDNTFIVSELFEEGQRTGFIIDTDLDEEKLISALETKLETKMIQGDNYTSNFISASLSNSFFKQAMYILFISFVLMSLVVFAYFRELVPSGAVVLSAMFDIVVTVGVLDFIGFKVSIAGIGALLMLIGYSIDTDVLLTNRLIKERGDNYFEKTFFAFKTGVLMSTTTLIAGIAALMITNSEVIFEISLILVIGLLVDFISTWLQNSAILLWWIEKKE